MHDFKSHAQLAMGEQLQGIFTSETMNPGFVQVMENLENHMEFMNFISRPGKSWNLIVGP